MTTSQSSNLSPAHRGRRRLLFGSVAAVLLLLIAILVIFLVRGMTPRLTPVLRLTPAAAAVDEQTMLLLSGSGWSRSEEVAICVSAASDSLCDATSALTVIQADQHGDIEADVRAGPLLGQGMTTFIASGLESGQVATRLFRVLKAADSSGTSGTVSVASSGDGLTSDDPIPVTTTGTPDPSVTSPGASWLGEYFANPDLSGTPALTREDLELAFNWALEAPDPSLPQDGFSARWSRRISFPAGSYRFLAEADGGLRLIIDGQMLIDEWQDNAALATYTATTELGEGEHEIEVAYVDQQGAASVALRWEALDAFVDWRGEYFANPDLSGQPALVRNDTAVDFDWSDASPAPGLVPADEFSVRWTRTLGFDQGIYRFSITANDGARVLVDDQIVIDAWSGPSDQATTADIPLTQGDHKITVQFFDNAGPARVVVGWSPILTETPAGGVGAPTPSQTPVPPGVPGGTLTPTWTPTAPPGSTATPTQPIGTPTPTVPLDSTPTATVPPGSTSTATPTVPPGSTSTATPTVPPGSTSTPTPTVTPTVPPGSTATLTPTPTTSPTPLRVIGLNPPEGPVDTLVVVSISGQWTPGAQVFVILLPRGVAIPPPDGQAVSTSASATTSNDGSAVVTQFRVPNDPRLTGAQPIQLVVHTGNWSEWTAEPFTIVVD